MVLEEQHLRLTPAAQTDIQVSTAKQTYTYTKTVSLLICVCVHVYIIICIKLFSRDLGQLSHVPLLLKERIMLLLRADGKTVQS